VKKYLWLAIAWTGAWSSAAVVQAEDAAKVKLEPTQIQLPTRLGPMRLTGEPHRYEQPALGVSYQYLGQGLSLTVYVYDAGLTDIPDGGDSMQTCWLFEEAKNNVGQAGYSDVKLISEQLVRLSPPADAPLAREAVFEYVRNGRPTLSYVWITGVSKNFVKMRFSMERDLRDEAIEARRAVLNALGEAIRPQLAPVDPKTEKEGISINISAGGNVEEMTMGILYSGILSTFLDKAPQAAPVCGGEFVPPFETELSVFKALLSMEKSPSELSKKLLAAEQAGFLDEFVWVERHREEWGTAAPEGLTLADYAKWKKKNLKRFKPPAFPSVIIKHPRPLAIEAADAL